MERELTEGRFILGISSNLNLSSFQKSTRVSLACPKEGRGPNLCPPRRLGAGYSLLSGSYGQLDSSVYTEAGPRAGGSEPPLTCRPSVMTFPLLQTQLAVLASLLAFFSPRRRQNQPQPLPVIATSPH